MSQHVGSVLERAVHLEPVLVLRGEVLYVAQHDAFAIGTRFSLQFHRGHFCPLPAGLNAIGHFGQDSDLKRWGLALASRGGKNVKKRP